MFQNPKEQAPSPDAAGGLGGGGKGWGGGGSTHHRSPPDSSHLSGWSPLDAPNVSWLKSYSSCTLYTPLTYTHPCTACRTGFSSGAPPASDMVPLPPSTPGPKLGTGRPHLRPSKMLSLPCGLQGQASTQGIKDEPHTPYLSPTTLLLRGAARYGVSRELGTTTRPDEQTAFLRALVLLMSLEHGPRTREWGLVVLTHHCIPSTGPCTQEVLNQRSK